MSKILNNLSLNLLKLLKENNLKIGTAESCTGGMLAQYLTMHPGSSESFNYGFITYSNEAKINILNINVTLLNNFGAVSKEIVCEMATNLLKYNNNIDIALAISGIAGPGGSLKNKPIGLVHHALATRNTIKHKKIIHKGNRESVRKLSVKTSLEMAISEIN
jgi:PncC family amidohydrolase